MFRLRQATIIRPYLSENVKNDIAVTVHMI